MGKNPVLKTVNEPNQKEAKYRASILGYTKITIVSKRLTQLNRVDKIFPFAHNTEQWKGLDTPIKGSDKLRQYLINLAAQKKIWGSWLPIIRTVEKFPSKRIAVEPVWIKNIWYSGPNAYSSNVVERHESNRID